MTDTFDDGKQIRLFESGSMMQYLVATYDKDYKISFPYGTREFYEMNVGLLETDDKQQGRDSGTRKIAQLRPGYFS